MQLLRYPGWLLGCCYAVSMWLLWYPGWLLRCCYAVARVLGLVGRVPGVVVRVLLCGFYVVARVPEVVAKVLLCGCYGTWGGC